MENLNEAIKKAVNDIVAIAPYVREPFANAEDDIENIIVKLLADADKGRAGEWHVISNPPLVSGEYLVTIDEDAYSDDASDNPCAQIVLPAFFDSTKYAFAKGEDNIGWSLTNEFSQFNEHLRQFITAWTQYPTPYLEDYEIMPYDAKWIIAADKLPPLGVEVLLSVNVPLWNYVTVGRYGNGLGGVFGDDSETYEWFDCVRREKISNPVAWMPFPDSFKGLMKGVTKDG